MTKSTLELALEAARDALYSCHSHCDPEVSNDDDAVAYRMCKQALLRLRGEG